MIDSLYRAIKYAAFNRQGFTVGGAEFTPEQVKQLQAELLQHMGDSVALQLIKERANNDQITI